MQNFKAKGPSVISKPESKEQDPELLQRRLGFLLLILAWILCVRAAAFEPLPVAGPVDNSDQALVLELEQVLVTSFPI